MNRIISLATAAALMSGALVLPERLRAEDRPEGAREGFAGRMREKLGISEEQEGKLKAARRAKRDAAAASHAELAAATRKLQDQLEDKAAEKDLSATLAAISAARAAMRVADEKFEAALASFLTPTQRAKMVVAMKGRAMKGMSGRPEHGQRGGKHERKGGERREEPDED